jgi:hypothetical protein
MSPSNRVKIAAYLVTGAWSLVVLIAGVKVPGVATKVLGVLPIVIVAMFALFDSWLWQVGPIKRLVKRPNLSGTWKGPLVSYRADSSGQEVAHPPIPIFLVIRQSYLDLSVTLLSAESRSRSIAALVQVNHADDYTVYYHYMNTPTLPFRNQSPVHSGGTRLDIAGVSPSSLDGEYWTDRRTRGTLTVSRASKKRFGTYADAAAELSEGGK